MNKKIITGIQARLNAGFLLLCLLIVGFGFFSSYTALKVLTRTVQDTLEFHAKRYLAIVENSIEKKYRELSLFASASKIWMKSDIKNNTKDEALNKIDRQYGYKVYESILFTDQTGNIVFDSSKTQSGNLSSEIWWINTKKHQYYRDSLVLDQHTLNPILPLSVSVYDDNGSFAGILRAEVNMTILTHEIELVGAAFETTRTRLVNGDGQLFYSTLAITPFESITETELWKNITEKSGSFELKENGKDNIYGYSTLYDNIKKRTWTLIIDNNSAEVLQPVYLLRTLTYIVLAIILLIGVIISLLISRSITIPLLKLQRAVKTVGPDNLSLRTNINSGDEIGLISKSFDEMMEMLENQAITLKEKNFIQEGQNRLYKRMRMFENSKPLATDILKEISDYSGADIGSFYLVKDKKLIRSAIFAYFKDKAVPESFDFGEGLVGQAASDKKIKIINTIPENYIYMGSDLGRASPVSIVLAPVLFNGEVKGVIELGFTSIVSDMKIEYLTSVLGSIGISINTLQGMEQERILLKQTEEQKHELQTQQEELRVSNEELEEQASRLRESEDRLKEQQQELEHSNVDLEIKNEQLEEKQRLVEEAKMELQKKADELEQASKYKSEFLSNMSHELRTPLNSLLLLARDLANNEEKNLNEEQVESANIIFKGGNDLLNLINQILDLSRIEAGRMELYFENINLKDIKERLETGFTKLAKEKNLDFSVEIEKNIPQLIYSDSMRLEQILRNLIGNAIKFTARGSVDVKFSKSESDEELLSISVRDTGIGIPELQKKAVFEAFQQGDGGTSRRYGGTGLGLSIARELAALLGGVIKLESEEGKGSIFTLYLPFECESGSKKKTNIQEILIPAESQQNLAVEPDSNPDKLNDDRNNLKDNDKVLLIIEDDLEFLKIVMKHCKNKGYKCIAASTGNNGLSLAKKHHPSGIILDLQLPGIDGYKVLSSLKEDPQTRHIPVHIISINEPTLSAFRNGAVGFLNKPVTKEQLDEVISKLIELSDHRTRNLLVVEDDEVMKNNIVSLLKSDNINIDVAITGEDAFKAVKTGKYHCIVMDLGLPDISGMELLDKMEELKNNMTLPPVIVYTGKDLTQDEEISINEHSDSIIIKDARSEGRLLDEVSLFLHQMIKTGKKNKKQLQTAISQTDKMFKEGKVLIVDDDMRALFAVSKLLTSRGLETIKAESGEKALKILNTTSGVDLILMDIMMPDMDGYETMKKIRVNEDFKNIPIIALTAKAMKNDREKCIEAGADDYMSKPVDGDKLISLIKVWLYGRDK